MRAGTIPATRRQHIRPHLPRLPRGSFGAFPGKGAAGSDGLLLDGAGAK